MFRFVVAFGTLAVISFLSYAQVNKNTQSPKQVSPLQHPEEQAVPLPILLREIGEKNGLYFTLEQLSDATNPANGRWQKRGRQLDLGRPNSVKPNNPDLLFKVDSSNTTIIHVIDKRLLAVKNYALQAPVAPLKFSGTRARLLETLSQASGIEIHPSASLPIQGIDGSNVTVAIKATTVRKALTAVCDISSAHLLWQASTSRQPSGGAYTQVEFYAPAVNQ